MIRFGLLLGAFCVLAGGVARAQSLEIYGKLPGIEAVDVSPDGSKAAVILSDGASRTILIKDLVKNAAVENLRFGEEKVTGLTWVGEDHLLILTTKTALMADITNARGEYALVFDFNLKTRKFRPLLGDADLNILTGAPFVRTIEGKPALFLEGVKEGRSSERYLDRFIGAETSKDPTMLEVSPRAHTAAANAPILLVHGKDDTVVPLEQSRWMADALKAAGKPVEFVVLDSTDHWLTKGETRLAMLNAVVAFLEKNNPPH